MPRYLFFYLFLFSISCLNIINNVKAQPASIVSLDTFGSDPYDKVANIGEYFITTGKTEIKDESFIGTRYDFFSTEVIDILKFENNQFQLLEQVNIPDTVERMFGEDPGFGYFNFRVKNIYTVNNFFVILAGTTLISASIENNRLKIQSKIFIPYPSSAKEVKIVIGDNGKIYAFSADTESSHHPRTIQIDTVTINSNGGFSSPLTYTFKLKKHENPISLNPAYDDNTLYLTSAFKEYDAAALYKIQLSESGLPENNIQLNFSEIKQQYHALYVKNDTFYLADKLDNFQVANLIDNQLILSKELPHGFHIDKIIPFQNKLITSGFSGNIGVFDIDNNEFNTPFSITSGTINDAVIYKNTFIFTKGENGIEAIDLSDQLSLSSVAMFDHSAVINDLTLHNKYLIPITSNNSIYVWDLAQQKLDTEYESYTTKLAAVESVGDDLIMINSDAIIKAKFDDIYNNISNKIILSELNDNSQYNQIIALDNGYLSILAGKIYAFNKSGQLLNILTFEQPLHYETISQKKATIYQNFLFLPINGEYSKTLIVDIKNLNNIRLVTELYIGERRFAYYSCNIDFYQNLMFTCIYGDGFNLRIFDVSDINNIQEIKKVNIDWEQNRIIHIQDNYMAIYGTTGKLYDIKNPLNPTLVSENLLINTSDKFIKDQNTVYSIMSTSTGHIQKSNINLAPQQQNINEILIEDAISNIYLPKIDNETDNISYEIKQMPSTGSLVLDDNQLTFTPETNSINSEIAILIAKDPHGNFTEFMVNYEITPVNDAPEFIVETLIVDEDNTLEYQIIAEDPDNDELSFSITQNPVNGQTDITDSGLLTYTPNENFFGEDSAIITVTDTEGASTSQEFIIEVNAINDAPKILNSEFTLVEDSSLSIQLTANDVENHTNEFSISNENPNAEISISSGGILTFKPNKNYFGTSIAKVTIKDELNDIFEFDITIQVTPVNDDPELKIVPLSINEDIQLDVRIEATDAENNNLEFELNKGANNGTSSISKTGQLTYMPNPNFFGQDEITITVRDEFGGLSTEKYTIDVLSINDFPTLIKKELMINEDEILTTQIIADDIDSTSLELSIEDQTKHGIASITQKGILTYIPNENYFGQDFIVITAADSDGAKTTEKFEIKIAPINDFPALLKKELVINEDETLTTQIIAGDIDSTSFELSIEDKTKYGIASITQDGILTYAPNENYFGQDFIVIAVIDSDDAKTTEEFEITIIPVADAPTISQTKFSTDEDTAFSVQLEVSDPDTQDYHFQLLEDSKPHGELILSDSGNLSYAPNEDFNGEIQANFKITDNESEFHNFNLTIVVNPIDDAPMIELKNHTVDFEDRFSSALKANDADGDNLTYSLISDVSNGTLVFSENGAYSYTPNKKFSGTDSFTYEVSDGTHVLSGKVTLNIKENPNPSSGGMLHYLLLLMVIILCSRNLAFGNRMQR